MTQRSIEMIVGRLVTDQAFRETFLRDPGRALVELIEQGIPVSATEMAALAAVDSAIWQRVAGEIDPRLQKASLKNS